MPERPLGRRARYRAQTRDEVKQIALRQIAEAGLEALSLNGVAREMGLTGPALYRYFTGRDELLAELVADAYGELADVVQAAAGFAATDPTVADARDIDGNTVGASVGEAGRRAARDRLRALAVAYRTWALAQPHRYRLLFGASSGSGALAPERTIPAAHRTMSVILDVLAPIVRPAAANDGRQGELDGQLATWVRDRDGPAVAGRIARLGVTFWTRLHGVLSLELTGHFTPMGFDPALLYDSEVEALLDDAG